MNVFDPSMNGFLAAADDGRSGSGSATAGLFESTGTGVPCSGKVELVTVAFPCFVLAEDDRELVATGVGLLPAESSDCCLAGDGLSYVELFSVSFVVPPSCCPRADDGRELAITLPILPVSFSPVF